MTIPRSSPLRSKPPRKRNVQRHKKEWLRAYGSQKRVKFVQSLPCLVDGCNRYPLARQCVHIKTGGTSRKADADKTVPLCYYHHMVVLHMIGVETFQEAYGIDLAEAAAETQKAWLLFSGESEGVSEA